MRRFTLIALVLALAVGAVLISGCRPKLTLDIRGSDTMVNLGAAWAEAYMARNRNASIAVQGGGTGTGITQLIAKNADIAMASRPIRPTELENGRRAGLDIKEITVAYDGVAMVVHPSNPVTELSLEQLSLIFRGAVTNWKELGGNDQPIVVMARDTASGTHVFVKEFVVQLRETQKENEYGPQTQFLASTAAIVTEVSRNPAAIGYVGLGYLRPEIRALGVRADAASPAVVPSVQTIANKSYPIARPLFFYVPQAPTGPLRAFLDWIRGPEGQAIVARVGFVPLN